MALRKHLINLCCGQQCIVTPFPEVIYVVTWLDFDFKHHHPIPQKNSEKENNSPKYKPCTFCFFPALQGTLKKGNKQLWCFRVNLQRTGVNFYLPFVQDLLLQGLFLLPVLVVQLPGLSWASRGMAGLMCAAAVNPTQFFCVAGIGFVEQRGVELSCWECHGTCAQTKAVDA